MEGEKVKSRIIFFPNYNKNNWGNDDYNMSKQIWIKDKEFKGIWV
jgi:hypothetical protein